MEMPKVSPQMLRLTELFAGTWKGEETLYPSEWDPVGGPAFGTWTVQPTAGGFCLAVDYVEERGGQVVYVGHGVHGHDARDGAFHAFWFDNIGVMPRQGNRATRPNGTQIGTTTWPGYLANDILHVRLFRAEYSEEKQPLAAGPE